MKSISIVLPLIVKIRRVHLEEFIDCEIGAHEDEITGPSPVTTVTILERNKSNITLNSYEEAAQVLDACRYGTFSNHFPRVADRIIEQLKAIPEVYKIWIGHDAEQWREFGGLVSEAKKELDQKSQ